MDWTFWLQLAVIAEKIARGIAEAKALSPEEFATKRAQLDSEDERLTADAKAALRALLPQG